MGYLTHLTHLTLGNRVIEVINIINNPNIQYFFIIKVIYFTHEVQAVQPKKSPLEYDQ